MTTKGGLPLSFTSPSHNGKLSSFQENSGQDTMGCAFRCKGSETVSIFLCVGITTHCTTFRPISPLLKQQLAIKFFSAALSIYRIP